VNTLSVSSADPQPSGQAQQQVTAAHAVWQVKKMPDWDYSAYAWAARQTSFSLPWRSKSKGRRPPKLLFSYFMA
jgi:hypothetical protein